MIHDILEKESNPNMFFSHIIQIVSIFVNFQKLIYLYNIFLFL